MSTIRDQLLEAYQLIKDGQRIKAESILSLILDADQNNADAWWLMANAVKAPDERREALTHVLRLRPDHAKAQQMLADLNARDMPDLDDLTGDDDLFEAEYGKEAPPIILKKPKRNNNTLIMVLAIFGAIIILGCGACAFAAMRVANVVETMADDPEVAMMFEELAMLVESEGFSGPARDRGIIEPGQTVQGTVSALTGEKWIFRGSQGDRLSIELNARDSTLDPVVKIYEPDGSFLAEDDDGGPDYNSSLEVQLPLDGMYTILASAYDQGGAYELIVRRR
jgi:hypothetical protein